MDLNSSSSLLRLSGSVTLIKVLIYSDLNYMHSPSNFNLSVEVPAGPSLETVKFKALKISKT